MSLNCLTCGGAEPRSNMNVEEQESYDGLSSLRCCWVDRNWSGNLTPAPYAHLRSRSIHVTPDDKKKGHRKISSTGSPLLGGMDIREAATAGPRLARSRGMRRDWSFEDLRNRNMPNATTKS